MNFLEIVTALYDSFYIISTGMRWLTGKNFKLRYCYRKNCAEFGNTEINAFQWSKRIILHRRLTARSNPVIPTLNVSSFRWGCPRVFWLHRWRPRTVMHRCWSPRAAIPKFGSWRCFRVNLHTLSPIASRKKKLISPAIMKCSRHASPLPGNT